MPSTPAERLCANDATLVAALRAFLQPAEVKRLHAMVAQVEDWEGLLDRAEQHGLLPLLARLLRGTEDVPEWVAVSLQGAERAAIVSSLRNEAGARLTMQALSEHGVMPVVLKGPAVARRLYDDPSLRPYCDIDLLIDASEWERTRAALLSLGATPEGTDAEVLPPRLSDSDPLDHHLAFRMPNGLRIECALDPMQIGIKMNGLEELRRKSVPLDSFGRSRRPSDAYELVVLCVHLNRHGYSRLIWFLDIALLIASNPSIDWSEVERIARAEGVAASVHHTLRLLSDLLGIPLPHALRATKPPILASVIWRRRWGRPGRSPLEGEHEGPLVFRRRRGRLSPGAYFHLLLANLLMTGRVGGKIAYFVLKAFPRRTFLLARYGLPDSNEGYLRLWLRRMRSGMPLADRTAEQNSNRVFNRAVSWNAVSKLSTRGIQFFITIALARLLVPLDFGLANMSAMVTTLVMMFAEFGFAFALVQKLHLTDNDIHTAWTISVTLGGLLTLVLVAVAPWVAQGFRETPLVPLLRAASLGMLVVSVAITPRALLCRRMDFRSMAIADLAASIAYGVVSVGMAVAGWGAWSLVVGALAMSVVRSLIVIQRAGHRFRFRVERQSLAELAPFGLKMLGTNFADYVRANVDYFVVGRTLGPAALGLYTIAFRLTDFPRSRLGAIVADVSLPAMSSLQQSSERVREAYRRSLRMSATVTVPFLLGLAALSREFVAVVYGERWLDSVAPLRVLLCAGLLLVVAQTATTVLVAIGKPLATLRLSVFYAGAVAAFAAVGVRYGIVGVAVGVLLATAFYAVGFQAVLWSAIRISPVETLRGIGAPLLSGLGMWVVVVRYRALVPFHAGMDGILWLLGAVSLGAVTYSLAMLPTMHDRGTRGRPEEADLGSARAEAAPQ